MQRSAVTTVLVVAVLDVEQVQAFHSKGLDTLAEHFKMDNQVMVVQALELVVLEEKN